MLTKIMITSKGYTLKSFKLVIHTEPLFCLVTLIHMDIDVIAAYMPYNYWLNFF